MSWITGAVMGYLIGSFFTDDGAMWFAVLGAILLPIIFSDSSEVPDIAKTETAVEQVEQKPETTAKEHLQKAVEVAKDEFEQENVY